MVSTLLMVLMARVDRSSMLPMGVAMMYSFPLFCCWLLFCDGDVDFSFELVRLCVHGVIDVEFVGVRVVADYVSVLGDPFVHEFFPCLWEFVIGSGVQGACVESFI